MGQEAIKAKWQRNKGRPLAQDVFMPEALGRFSSFLTKLYPKQRIIETNDFLG